MNRAVRIGGPAVALLVAVLAVLAALAIGGGAAAGGIDDPGVAVRYGVPIAQMLVNVAAACTLGPLVLAVFSLDPRHPAWSRTLDFAAGSAAAWTVVAGLMGFEQFLLINAPISMADSNFGATLLAFFTASPSRGEPFSAGGVWLTTVLIAAVVTVLCFAVRSRVGVAFVTIAAGLALYPMAQSGHAASLNANHDAAISSFGLHIVFAAIWLGGLIAIVVVGRQLTGEALAQIVSRYSSIALICFVVVGISGVVNADIRIGTWADVLTPYGALVVVKSVALLGLAGFGAVQRTVLIRRVATAAGRAPFWVMVGLELCLMGVASGFAAALSLSQPPVPAIQSEPALTPSQILTQTQLPPSPSPFRYVTTWNPDIIWLLVCGFGLVFYLAGVRRLRRRGDAWPVGRTICWTAGMLVLAYLTSGALNEYERYLFSAHMLLHMALAMVVPLLLVPSAPVTLAMRAIRKRTDGSWGGREWILWAVHTPFARVVSNPIVAAVLFAGSLIAFYYSPLFSWATTDHVGHEWMTVHFLITGYLFVQSMIGIDPGAKRLSYPLRLLVLLATMAFHAFFGLALLQSRSLLLPYWYGAMGWGTSALADQQTAGGIAWGVGEIPTLALAIFVAMSWSRDDDREAKRLDRKADRGGDVDLNEYNDMLARLNR